MYLGQTSRWLVAEGEASRPMLEWSDVIGFAGNDVEIGAHGHSHRQLDTLARGDAIEDVTLCKSVLEDRLGIDVRTLAYPHGYSTRALRREVESLGFTSACGVKHALSSVRDDRFALARLIIGDVPMTASRTTPVALTAVSVESPAPRDVWHRVAGCDPNALVTQTPQWMDAMIEATGCVDASRWYVTEDGRDLVLPLARRRFGGSRGLHSSLAEGWGMGGFLSSGGVEESEVRLIMADLAILPALRTSVRPNPLVAQAWREGVSDVGALTKPRLAHVLDLEDGAEAVWHDQMTSQARRGVRRARKLEVEITLDVAGELLPVFYDMLLQSFDRWAARQHEPRWMTRFRGRRRDPLSKFEAIASHLGSAFRLYVARHDGRPAAAVIVLVGANAQYKWGVMDAEVGGRTNANDLLHWTAIEDACASGCAEYHMGESAEGSTLARYKEKLGARSIDYTEYLFERLPVTRIDRSLRSLAKSAIGFRDG
jgi:hypothetical protein